MRLLKIASTAAILLGLSGCGYHTLGAATHLPPDTRTLAVPVFATRTETYHTEGVMTEAVIREFATRTRLRVTPNSGGDPDAVLHGTILKEVVAPLTYNTSTQQSSSFLITMVVSVTLTGRDGKILYENKIMSSGSSTNRRPTCRRFWMKARRPWKGFRATLRDNWLPMCWKEFSRGATDRNVGEKMSSRLQVVVILGNRDRRGWRLVWREGYPKAKCSLVSLSLGRRRREGWVVERLALGCRVCLCRPLCGGD